VIFVKIRDFVKKIVIFVKISDFVKIRDFCENSYSKNSQFLCTVWGCTVHTPHRSQYAAITQTTSCMRSTYPLLTKCVILAKYWVWLPDEGFLVNRNMLEQFHLF